MEFENLKEQYGVLKKKYDLPEFEELNSVFDIGKIDKESENLLRDFRGIMMEKVIHYIRLLELMVNPAQSTPVFMIFLKEITPTDKDIMNKVFNNFVILELESFKLDIESTEEKEAKHLKNTLEIWNKTKKDLKSLIDLMERNWKSDQKKDDKKYFG